MKNILVQTLNIKAFRIYGDFFNLLQPESPFFQKGEPQFYSDLIRTRLSNNAAAISICSEQKRPETIIEFAEFHRYTEELIVPLTDDVIIYCAPPTETSIVPFNFFEAFYVPKGTAVKLRCGVWHGCQFPIKENQVQTLCLLPERTYANDCFCYFFKDSEKIKIQNTNS